MDGKFSLEKISNWVIILIVVVAFAVYMLFFDRNLGYWAVVEQNHKIDTLLMQCNELRGQIEIDSTALESVYDSAKFEHYLREQRLFVGDGETMYNVKSDE